ncbi:MAG: phasin family protein [Alphaproteobacteria bacterium]
MATAQRRNVEAMTAVCQLAFDCVQQSAQRQTQLFRDTAEEMLGSFRRVGRLDDPEEQANAQLAAGRHALERGMASLRELAELIARTNAEALEIIKQRASGFNEGLDVSKRDAGKGTNQP